MKIVEFNSVAYSKHIILKETHGVPALGDKLIMTDERADYLCGNNSQGLVLGRIAAEAILVTPGQGDWAREVLKREIAKKNGDYVDTINNGYVVPTYKLEEQAADDIKIEEVEKVNFNNEELVNSEVKVKKVRKTRSKNK